jgi:hypothetical protein
MASIFESQKHRLDNKIIAFKSCNHPCCPSSRSSEISLQTPWKHNCHECTTNPQWRGFKEGLRADFSCFQCAKQHWKPNASCRRSDVAMLPCHLCMDGSLLQKHSLAFNQAATLPCVRSTELVIWRREFIIVAIERLSAILPKNDTCDSGR